MRVERSGHKKQTTESTLKQIKIPITASGGVLKNLRFLVQEKLFFVFTRNAKHFCARKSR
ncbi:hypothetical protein COV18_00135 [Candidatus Woesearchaeota archaeon CG10_big_fil_rev_8_21_14_0_10_37_12]|nr:MAG: hypothetical protein COV18_00135 [Candidatus Woesearchaeota archaeon CG10_big_fil_rev_8_21_14_0_10_37_12]